MGGTQSPSRIAIGRIARPHGVRGELKVHLYYAASETLSALSEITLGDRLFAIESARRLGGAEAAYLVRLGGVTTREAADALRDLEVLVPRNAIPLGDGEFLVADVVGCNVFDVAGRAMGVVKEVFHSGAHEVIVMDDERMIPLVPEWVREVDVAGRRVVVEKQDLDQDQDQDQD